MIDQICSYRDDEPSKYSTRGSDANSSSSLRSLTPVL